VRRLVVSCWRFFRPVVDRQSSCGSGRPIERRIGGRRDDPQVRFSIENETMRCESAEMHESAVASLPAGIHFDNGTSIPSKSWQRRFATAMFVQPPAWTRPSRRRCARATRFSAFTGRRGRLRLIDQDSAFRVAHFTPLGSDRKSAPRLVRVRIVQITCDRSDVKTAFTRPLAWPNRCKLRLQYSATLAGILARDPNRVRSGANVICDRRHLPIENDLATNTPPEKQFAGWQSNTAWAEIKRQEGRG